MPIPKPVLPDLHNGGRDADISRLSKDAAAAGRVRSHSEAVVATIWLVFYVLGLAVAVSSPIISRAIELAAH